MSQHTAVPVRATIHVVDDDEATRTATARLLRAAGYEVQVHGDPAEFLACGAIAPPSCAILDLQMPGLNGVELQEHLHRWPDPPAIVFVSGHARVADSVRAMRQGAVDFLIKPVPAALLLESISQALAQDAENRARRFTGRELQARYEQLTPREREVLPHLVAGKLNKQIAFDLQIAERTIKIHRARILKKMKAGSIADLVRMANALAITPAAVAG